MHCRGIWDWGAEFKKELTKEKFKDRIRVTRARDRSVDTKAFTFLREHVKGTRARLERVRGAAKQCIAALRQQAEHACVWAAELELLATQHWRSGVCVSAIQAMARSLQHAERQRILVIVSALERMLEAVDMLISLYDAAREEKLRLYWARGALEEAADKVAHYRRKINDGKTNQESKMQGALRDVLVAQRTFQQLNDAMPKDMVQLEAYAGVVLLDTTEAYLASYSAALNSTLVGLKVESVALGHACDPAAAWHGSRRTQDSERGGRKDSPAEQEPRQEPAQDPLAPAALHFSQVSGSCSHSPASSLRQSYSQQLASRSLSNASGDGGRGERSIGHDKRGAWAALDHSADAGACVDVGLSGNSASWPLDRSEQRVESLTVSAATCACDADATSGLAALAQPWPSWDACPPAVAAALLRRCAPFGQSRQEGGGMMVPAGDKRHALQEHVLLSVAPGRLVEGIARALDASDSVCEASGSHDTGLSHTLRSPPRRPFPPQAYARLKREGRCLMSRV